MNESDETTDGTFGAHSAIGLKPSMDVFDVTDPSSATQSSTSSSPDRLRDPLNDDPTPSWLLSAVAAANEKASAAGQPSGTLSKLPIELITNILSCARAEYSLHSSMAHRCFFSRFVESSPGFKIFATSS